MVSRMDSLMDMNMTMMDHSTMGHHHMHGAMNTTMNPMGTNHAGHGEMNHTGMDHGNMDHGNMDHGGGMGGMGGHGMMKMYFSTEWKMTYVLFEQCMLMEGWQLAVACILLAIIAALYEGLKVFREHLLYTYQVGEKNRSRRENGRDLYLSESSPSSSKVEITSSSPQHSVRTRMCSWLHFTQTILHMLQITVSYLLMLVVMTYNIYLCLSVVLGAGIGYFLFSWKRAVVNDRNEHCH